CVVVQTCDYPEDIFDTLLLFLDDDALVVPARRLIFEEKRNAAEAWNMASEDVARQYRTLDDEYMRARAEDLTAVARQVVAQLTGRSSMAKGIEEPGILIAEQLTPADTAGLDTAIVQGIAT